LLTRACDVRDGNLTIEGAPRDYGVVIKGDPERVLEGLTIEVEATQRRREGRSIGR
jgi:N-methylhydantoinase B